MIRTSFTPIFCTILLLIIIGCETTPHQTSQQRAEQNWQLVRAEVKYQLATQQLGQDRLADAVTSLREAVALAPDNPTFLRLLAKCNLEMGNIPEATRNLTQAADLGDTSAEFHYAAGLLAERRNEPDRAVHHFKEAFDQDPTQIDHLTAYTETLVTLGQFDDARTLINHYLNDFDRAPKLLVARATIAELQNDLPKAERDYSEAYARNEEATWIAERHALLLVRMGEFAKAMPILQSLLADNSESMMPESSVSSFTANIKNTPASASKPSLVRALATCHNRTGTTKAARTMLYDHLDNYATDARAWWLLAEANVRLQDWNGAHSCIDRGKSLAPNRPEWDLLRAYLIAKQEGPESASKHVDRLAQQFPDFAPAQFMLESLNGTPNTETKP